MILSGSFEFIRGLHSLPRGGLCGFPTPQNFNGKQDIRGKTQLGLVWLFSRGLRWCIGGGLLTALGEEFKSNSPWRTRGLFRVWNGSSLLVQFYLKLWLISAVSVQHKLITMRNQTAHTSCWCLCFMLIWHTFRSLFLFLLGFIRGSKY